VEKKTTRPIPLLLVVLTITILGISYYFISGGSEKEPSLEEVNIDLNAEHKKDPKEKEADPAPVKEEYLPVIANEEKPIPKAVPQPSNKNEAPPSTANAQRDDAMKKQIPLIYEDLFKELALPEEKRKQVEEHLAKSMKSEADFGFKLFDPNVSVDEVLREQERLSSERQRGLGGILSLNEQELVTKHQNDLPKKAQDKHIGMIVESLKLEESEKENVRSALDRAMQNMDERKRIGQFTAQDIAEARKQFGGAKPGTPEFMRANIEASATHIQGVLKDLEHLPQYEAIKMQIVMPLEMMRQSMKQQPNQGPR
jgi:hypothetical protein